MSLLHFYPNNNKNFKKVRCTIRPYDERRDLWKWQGAAPRGAFEPCNRNLRVPIFKKIFFKDFDMIKTGVQDVLVAFLPK